MVSIYVTKRKTTSQVAIDYSIVIINLSVLFLFLLYKTKCTFGLKYMCLNSEHSHSEF